MSKVILIGISSLKGGSIKEMKSVDAVKGKGLLNDRKLRENNDKKSQLTLIEIESINDTTHVVLNHVHQILCDIIDDLSKINHSLIVYNHTIYYL